MPVGGRREGAGRPRGSKSTRTREIADRAAQEGLTPLEYMLKVLRDEEQPDNRRDDMAKAAAPYIHPRLATMQHQGDKDNPLVHEIVRRVVD